MVGNLTRVLRTKNEAAAESDDICHLSARARSKLGLELDHSSSFWSLLVHDISTILFLLGCLRVVISQLIHTKGTTLNSNLKIA